MGYTGAVVSGLVYQDVEPGVCIGALTLLTITPDLTTPGNQTKHIDLVVRDVDRDLPLGSACRDVFHSAGVFTHL